MLQTQPPTPGLLFGSFLYKASIPSEELRQLWEEQWGKSFSFIPRTNPLEKYYSYEMGEDLRRIFFVTTTLYPREFLLSGKLLAIEWELQRASMGRRTVNIDIGFLCPENFQLATTKNYSHRIYLGHNIYSDLTFYFYEGELQALPWTYPDYLDDEKKEFFTWARSFLLSSRN